MTAAAPRMAQALTLLALVVIMTTQACWARPWQSASPKAAAPALRVDLPASDRTGMDPGPRAAATVQSLPQSSDPHGPQSMPEAPARYRLEAEDSLYEAAAALAWRQFDALYVKSTGLARATPDYAKLTTWDVGSTIAALYSARVLDLISEAEFDQRMTRTLRTLQTVRLFRNANFNRMYMSDDGGLVSRGGGPSTRGYGWSATDTGRLLLWLHIIAENNDDHRAAAQKIVQRLDFSRMVEQGYMYGEDVGSSGKTRRFQEGRIGYEQYAAAGFAAWGAPVDSALTVTRHAKPVDVLGVEIPADTRGLDRITSEPFVLLGMETGWSTEMERIARAVLAAQAARFERSGTLTMVSEDAISIAPFYFYYYCVYCNGKAFTVDVSDPGRSLDKPRWVSTKAAFAWHALLPDEYTGKVLTHVQHARGTRGWSSGVFEDSDKSTNTLDINTAAIVLEAAAYRKLGRPLIDWRRSGRNHR